MDEGAQRLKDSIGGVVVEVAADLIAMEVLPDHVPLLVEVDPQFGIHSLVKRVKGRSSRLLRQEFPKLNSRLPTLGTNRYFVSSVGGAARAVIKHYIEDQKNA